MKIVMTLEDGTKGRDYFASLEAAGLERAEIQPLFSRDLFPHDFDGLLLSGGEDVDPALYCESRNSRLGRVNRRRDDQELALIGRARELEVPVFGICRGLQILNVAFGGALLQDIPALHPSTIDHHVRAPKDFPAHAIRVTADGFLGSRDERWDVNSRHHQAVGRTGNGLRVAAQSDDGIVEAVELPGHGAFIFAVQWHPENLETDRRSKDLFRRFVAGAGRNRPPVAVVSRVR